MQYLSRSKTTLEIIFSKIFPAGFGWQFTASFLEPYIVSNTAIFAVGTGLGEGAAVYCGHQVWMNGKSKWDETVDLKNEKKISKWLGSSACLSGTIWQPTVNIASEILPFYPTMMFTGIMCGSTFYGGLRLFRKVYQIENGTKKDDAQLALSIGGATGCFVATDPLILGNTWTTFHITPSIQPFNAYLLAGTSTAFGFSAMQTMQNLLCKKIYLDK